MWMQAKYIILSQANEPGHKKTQMTSEYTWLLILFSSLFLPTHFPYTTILMTNSNEIRLTVGRQFPRANSMVKQNAIHKIL